MIAEDDCMAPCICSPAAPGRLGLNSTREQLQGCAGIVVSRLLRRSSPRAPFCQLHALSSLHVHLSLCFRRRQ